MSTCTQQGKLQLPTHSGLASNLSRKGLWAESHVYTRPGGIFGVKLTDGTRSNSLAILLNLPVRYMAPYGCSQKVNLDFKVLMYNSLLLGAWSRPPLTVLHLCIHQEQEFVEALSGRQRNARENLVQLCPTTKGSNVWKQLMKNKELSFIAASNHSVQLSQWQGKPTTYQCLGR